MTKRRRHRDDPVVAEVRAIRSKLWKAGGGTVAGLLRIIEDSVRPPQRRGRGKRQRIAP